MSIEAKLDRIILLLNDLVKQGKPVKFTAISDYQKQCEEFNPPYPYTEQNQWHPDAIPMGASPDWYNTI